MIRTFTTALRLLLGLSVLTGLLYPLLVTVLAQGFFPKEASGNPHLIAQKFTSKRYFWPRPSAVDFNPLPSGGSNLSPTSHALLKLVEERRQSLLQAHPTQTGVPQDLLFASGSGLDPDISPEAALFQVDRVAHARGIDAESLRRLVSELTKPRQFGILGEPRLNVLELNLALDRI